MTAPEIIAARHQKALTELADILTKHDAEVGERIRRAKNGGSVPGPVKRPLDTAAYHAECMLSLARIIDERLTPRKRGRPRKNAG
jgi:hypothetical protein